MSEPIRTAPLDENERAGVLDALRGFALLGIFISHVPGFSGYEFLPAVQQAALDRFGVDAYVTFAHALLVRGKFFSLFSLLFGIGFSIQLESARRRGARFAAHFSRRLAILLGIGLVHGLIWYGDILRDYALLGLLLIPTARRSARATARLAVGVLAARALWPLLMFGAITQLAPLASTTATGDPALQFFARARAFAEPDWPAVFFANLGLLRLKALQMIYDGKAISVLSMFFVGSWIGKVGLYRDLPAQRRTLARVFALTAPLGLIGNVVLVRLHAATADYPPSPAWVAEQVLFAFAVPALTLAYASGFALLWSGPARRVLGLLAPAGRMALTTYVSETLIAIALFYGVALGWWGTIGALECDVVAIAIFSLQCALCAAWLHRFRFGPLEWCWRRATYGVPLAMLRR